MRISRIYLLYINYTRLYICVRDFATNTPITFHQVRFFSEYIESCKYSLSHSPYQDTTLLQSRCHAQGSGHNAFYCHTFSLFIYFQHWVLSRRDTLCVYFNENYSLTLNSRVFVLSFVWHERFGVIRGWLIEFEEWTELIMLISMRWLCGFFFIYIQHKSTEKGRKAI